MYKWPFTLHKTFVPIFLLMAQNYNAKFVFYLYLIFYLWLLHSEVLVKVNFVRREYNNTETFVAI